MSTEPQHLPVLLEEALGFLAPERGGRFVDCTVGLGGHAAALLERFPDVTLIGFDRDPQALAQAARRLEGFGERVRLIRGRFSEIRQRLAEIGITKIDGILADLGVSSLQLDEARRGFSFSQEGPLDMRMGSEGPTAADVVNHYTEKELTRIIKAYGEEPQARRIARAIVEERANQPFETTADLCQVVERVKGPRFDGRPRGGFGRGRSGRLRGRRIHPATQVFQALRIEVNRELQELAELLEESIELLDQEGRIVVISYHSLEDRKVKHRLRELASGTIEPVTGQRLAETQVIEVLTKKPVRPSDEEVERNPRSRSARLRAGKRL